MATNAVGKAEQAGDSAPLEVLARVELIAYGVVHLLVGWPHPSGGMRRPHRAVTPAGTRIGACDPPVDPTVTLAYQDRRRAAEQFMDDHVVAVSDLPGAELDSCLW